jgi:hypothetical protein
MKKLFVLLSVICLSTLISCEDEDCTWYIDFDNTTNIWAFYSIERESDGEKWAGNRMPAGVVDAVNNWNLGPGNFTIKVYYFDNNNDEVIVSEETVEIGCEDTYTIDLVII